jgi:hypothetical protein
MPNEPFDPAKSSLDPKSWPPAVKTEIIPEVVEESDVELTHCPHCRHKLLTHRSVLCNWCGQPIKDEKYLARAAAERAAADEAERRKVQIENEETAKFGIVGRLRRKAKEGGKPAINTADWKNK